MMQTIELSSPAKINLFLDVLGRRDDGYHDIITVFEKIDLCDRIRLTPSETEHAGSGKDIAISSNLKELPTDKNNLAYRACSLLRKTYGISKGVKIHIEKRIPIAAGLGGGSSNAATTLKGLNKLWGLNLTDKELVDICKKIGADVPFFIFNYSFAIGSGRGDDIKAIKSDLEMWHVIISPPVHVSTKETYGNSSLNLTEERGNVKMIVRAIEQKDLGGVKKHLYNALEPVVTKKVTDISRVKDFVKKRGFDAGKVTGSGPTIFVLTGERKEAEKLRDDFLSSFVPDKFRNDWKIFVARTLKAPDKEIG